MKRKAHPGVFLDGGGGDFFAHTGSGFFSATIAYR